MRTRLPKSRSRGFTLLETALTTVIIGTGVIALIQLLAAGTMSNGSATELTTAVNLANNIHEIALALPFINPNNPTSTTSGGATTFNYLWDLNGNSYSPPLDIRKNAINTYSNWSQVVTVNSVDQTNLTAIRPNGVPPTGQPTARLTVVISHHGKAVYQASWLIAVPNS